MNPQVPTLFLGEKYAMPDGDDVKVVELNSETGRVVVQTPEGRKGVVNLDDMIEGLRTGEVLRLEGESDD